MPAAAQEGSPTRLSFDRAVTSALDQNPSVQTAQQEVRRATALVTQVQSLSMPTVAGNLGYIRLDANRVSGSTVVQYAGEATGNVTAAVPLIAPSFWARWSHALDNADVSRLSAADVKRQTAILVAHTYLSVVAEHRVIDVQTRARDNARAHVDYTSQRATAGIGPRLDAVRAEQELASDGSQLAQSLAQIVRGQEALGVLLGLEHAVDTDEDVALDALPSVDEALVEAQRNRTDVKLADERLRAARNVARDDYTDYLPTLSGSFAPFFQTPPTAQYPDKGWVAMITLSLPLYDGGLRYGLARERDALQAESTIHLDETHRQASSDVRAAAEAVTRTRQSLVSARVSAFKAKQALDMSNIAYRAGASTNIEVIDAERAALDADTAAAVAEDSVRQASVDLLAASGRFPRLAQ
jgi:outer membrane protein TolC